MMPWRLVIVFVAWMLAWSALIGAVVYESARHEAPAAALDRERVP